MDAIILALKISMFTTPIVLVIVALVRVGSLKQDHERTKSVLKAAMVEIDRLTQKIDAVEKA